MGFGIWNTGVIKKLFEASREKAVGRYAGGFLRLPVDPGAVAPCPNLRQNG